MGNNVSPPNLRQIAPMALPPTFTPPPNQNSCIRPYRILEQEVPTVTKGGAPHPPPNNDPMKGNKYHSPISKQSVDWQSFN